MSPERKNYFLRSTRSTMEFQHLSRVYIIGAPGAGKGSLCTKLSADYGFHHFSVGDALRVQAETGALRPDLIKAIQASALLETEDLASILHHAIEKLSKDGKQRLLIDGVPRSVDQIEAIEAAVGAPDLVLFFECPERIAMHRFLIRQLPGRVDKPEVFEARWAYYLDQNVKIVAHYKERGLLVTVDTSGDVEASYARLLAGLRSTEDFVPH